MAEEKLIGKVTHYYGQPGVAIIALADVLKVGQTVRFKGASDDFTQNISQMQFEHKDIIEGKKGQEVGVKADQKVHENDEVYLVE